VHVGVSLDNSIRRGLFARFASKNPGDIPCHIIHIVFVALRGFPHIFHGAEDHIAVSVLVDCLNSLGSFGHGLDHLMHESGRVFTERHLQLPFQIETKVLDSGDTAQNVREFVGDHLFQRRVCCAVDVIDGEQTGESR
jgi:hypothetical protein